MTDQRITVVNNFEMLIARAGFTKDGLAKAAGITRGVIPRAISADENGSSLRLLTAWKIARVYAERAELDYDSAFAQLFVVTGEAYHGTLAHRPIDAAPTAGSVMNVETSEPVSQPHHHEPSAVHSTALKKTANLWLDEESLAMLDALVQDEDRSSQRDMIRVLIKRAYRALIARQSTTDTTRPTAPISDHRQNETQEHGEELRQS